MRYRTSCYCITCKRDFDSLGIARHRAMHRDKKQLVEILMSTGKTYQWDYREKKATIKRAVAK